MDGNDAAVKRLAGEIRARRLELGWSQQRLATEAGISVATLRKLEGGMQAAYRHLTVVPLCRALGWPPSFLDELVSGERSAADEPADNPTGNPTGTSDPRLAAFDGDLAKLSETELAAVIDFVRQLRNQ